jgi:glc operon protein GlcG
MSEPKLLLETITLSHEGAMLALRAAIDAATAIGVPQCIVIVDASGETIASLRMSGARYLSMRTARAKAQTAASINGATGQIGHDVGAVVAITSQGGMTSLPGGLPIRFAGKLAGAIGVGSGTGEQDVVVARAALAALGADGV